MSDSITFEIIYVESFTSGIQDVFIKNLFEIGKIIFAFDIKKIFQLGHKRIET